jgi:hypothetical protein
MSRTVRRTSYKKQLKSGRSHFVEDYVSDRIKPEGVDAWAGGKRVLLTGKEYEQAYHAFHGDTKRGYGWGNHIISRQISIQSWRIQNKAEIIRFIKDNDYEVMMHNPRCLSWDR